MPSPHPPEFRRRAVELVRNGDKSVSALAKSLGIRRDVRDGLSIRAVMCKHGVSHPTVRQALDSAWPKPRPRPRRRPSSGRH